MAKISVIIPVYNVEKYLKQCLDSVVNQTLKDIEIICVDDGSTDNSGTILDEYASKDNRIKVIHKENGGLSSARNEGLKYISSEYCYFLDSDDYIDSNLLENAYNILQNNDVDYYCFGSAIFIDDKSITQDINSLNEYLQIKFNGIKKAIFDVGLNQNIHVWNKIFKTSIIKKYNIHFIEGLLYEDIFFTWYYFFLSNKIYFDQYKYHHYRICSNSIMEKTTSNKSYDSAVSHLLNWYELFKEISKNKNLFKKNCRNLLILLKNYEKRTIKMSKSEDKSRIKELVRNYKKEFNKEFISKYGLAKYILNCQNLFWYRKNICKSIICLFGIKITLSNANYI